MDYQKFKMELIEQVQKEISSSVKVTYEKIPKNNGIYLEGMIFTRAGDNASPVIYVDEYYQFWKKGVSMEQLVEKILWSYGNYGPKLRITDEFFRDYEKLKYHIFYKLINYEMNRELLRKMPHRRVLDLAMVFYYSMEEGEAAGTVLIKNSHLRMWKITIDELENNARKYTCLALPAEFLTMAMLTGMKEDEMEEPEGEERCPMYILTNKQRRLGAGTFLYPGILEQAQKFLGENFYILPSSVHECIFVPENEFYGQAELSRMMAEINENHVESQEVLSDQAYYFCGKDGRIHV